MEFSGPGPMESRPGAVKQIPANGHWGNEPLIHPNRYVTIRSMDKLILGLLMLKRLTVYEIRREIRANFSLICSDSLGSIQAAMKKLLAAQLVKYSEYTEKGVNKKRYSITAKGRRALADWLEIPAEMAASKNMDLAKLLFMGFVPAEKRLQMINAIILKLETELSGLRRLWDHTQAQYQESKKQAAANWKSDSEYLNGILKMTQSRNIADSTEGIGFFQMCALQYGIDVLQFNADWFGKLRKKMEKGEKFR